LASLQHHGFYSFQSYLFVIHELISPEADGQAWTLSVVTIFFLLLLKRQRLVWASLDHNSRGIQVTNVAVLEWLTAVKHVGYHRIVMFTCFCSLRMISNKQDMMIRFFEGP
jgi:hypothetical protein